MISRNDIIRATVDLDHGVKDLAIETIGDGAPGGLGGATRYENGKVVSLIIPAPSRAQERTIRIHELIHAQRQVLPKRINKQRAQSIEYQAIMDVLVHTRDWPANLPQRANRDAMCTALQNLRTTLIQPNLTTDPDIWNVAVLVSIRALAIANSCGSARHLAPVNAMLAKIGGERFGRALQDIIDTAQRRNKQKTAEEMLRRLLLDKKGLPIDDKRPGRKEGGNKIGGTRSNPPFEIINLPHTAECSPEGCGTRAASSGPRLILRRVPRALLTGSTGGLFRRPVRQLGGTVLIDASGSMNANADILQAICLAAPACTIAYYCGSSMHGKLFVFARQGRRFAGTHLPHPYRGNECDLQAMRWLLQEENYPKYIVTDKGFRGGAPGSAEAALLLLDRALRAKQVQVIDTLPQALALFLARKKQAR
jgi:hypothetical protein